MKRRIWSILLCAVLLIGSIPMLTRSVEAVEEVVTHDVDEIRNLLKSNKNVVIRLDGDAEKNLTGMSDFEHQLWRSEYWTWVELGQGSKTIILDGYRLYLYDRSYRSDGSCEFLPIRKGLMMLIPAGSSLRIDDPTGRGKIWMDAEMPDKDLFVTDNCFLERFIFAVDGGNLTVTGGEIHAGRAKDIYVSGADRYFWNWVPMDGVYSVYHGYATQFISGNAITAVSGNVTITGGSFWGRGWTNATLVERVAGAPNGPDDHRSRCAALELEAGASAHIYGGSFYGRGDASAVHTWIGATLTVDSGTFDVSTNSNLAIPGTGIPSVHLAGVPVFSVIMGTGGYTGVRPENINPLSDYGYTAPDETLKVTPGKNLPFVVSDGSQELGERYYWDGVSDITLDALFDEFWESKPYGSRSFYYVRSTEELGSSPAVIIGGETYYDESAGSPVTIHTDKGFDDGSRIVDNGNGTRTLGGISLLDFMPTGMEEGDSFQLEIGVAEYLLDPEGGYIESAIWQKTIYVERGSAPHQITEQPADSVATSYGGTVTLSATIDSPSATAWWERTLPGAERIDPDDPAVVTSSNVSITRSILTIPVHETEAWRCVFIDENGASYRSDTAAVSYTFELTVPHETVNAKTGQGSVSLRVIAGTKDIGDLESSWYKDGVQITSNGHFAGSTSTKLVIMNPRLEDAGVYTCRIGEVVSSEITLNVTEGDPDNYITRLDFYGLDENELYVGDNAPGSITWDEYGLKSLSVSWTAGVSNGRIVSPNPSYTIHVRTDYPSYWFKTDGEGYFTWTMNGVLHKSYIGTANWVIPELDLSYTFDNHHPLRTTPSDVIRMEETVFDVPSGKSVDLTLRFSLQCSPRHASQHTITGLSVSGVKSLPTGLSLTNIDLQHGIAHITGVCTDAIGSSTVSLLLFATDAGEGQYEPENPVPVYLTLNVVRAKQAQSVDLPPLHLTHSFDEWTDHSDGLNHEHTCSVCGATVTEPHNWDDGVITTAPTPDSIGEITYTCLDCGAHRCEDKTYEPGDLSVPFELIRSVAVTSVTEPVAGHTPSTSAAAQGEGNDAVLSGVWWNDDTTGVRLDGTDTFEEGHAYTVHVPVKTTGSAQFVLSGLTATINGRPADVRQGDGIYATVSAEISVSMGVCSGNVISSIELLDVTVPTPGTAASRNCSFSATGYRALTYYWYCLQEDGTRLWMGLDPFDFVAGGDYQLDATFLPTDGHSFADGVTVTVNGEPVDEIEIVGDMVHIKKNYIWTGPVIVDEALINLRLPVAGETPSYTASVGNPSLYQPDPRYGISGCGFYWYDDESNILDLTDHFEAGKTYQLELKIIQKMQGYIVSSKFGSPLTILLNGESVGDVWRGEKVSYLYYDYTCPAAEPASSDFAITVMEPSAGEHPRMLATGLPDGVNTYDIYWYDETDGVYVTQDDVFLDGHDYRITLRLNTSGTSATINGHAANIAENRISYTFVGVPTTVEGSLSGSVLSAQVSVQRDAKLIAAVYDGNRQLIDVAVIDVDSDSESVPTGLTVTDGYTYKLILTSDNSFTPLCEAWTATAW